MKTDSELLDLNYLGYRHSAALTTVVFFFVGMMSSYLGFTSSHFNFEILGGDGLISIFIGLGLIISINERIMELFRMTYRRNTRALIELRMLTCPPEMKNRWEDLFLGYKAETGRLIITLSLIFGCFIASTGFFRILGGFSADEYLSSEYHHVFFDAFDVVVTGWVIAGGSQGYYKLLDSVSNLLKLKTDLDKTSVSKVSAITQPDKRNQEIDQNPATVSTVSPSSNQ